MDRETTPHAEGKNVTRRNVIRFAWGGALVALLAEAGGTFLDFFRPRKVGAFGSKVTAGKPDDYQLGSVTWVTEGKFYVSHVPEGFLALYQKCPHLGCVVPWHPDDQSEDKIEPKGRFNCPCHGSIYNRYGQIVAGPAPRPLDLMALQVVNGKIVVDTGKITSRSQWDPSQAVKV